MHACVCVLNIRTEVVIAIVQERRCFIPQGWSKFYEFSLADLRTAASVIDRLCKGKGNSLSLCMCVCVCVCVYISLGAFGATGIVFTTQAA